MLLQNSVTIYLSQAMKMKISLKLQNQLGAIGNLHKVHVIHPIQMITRQNQYVFYTFEPCILHRMSGKKLIGDSDSIL
jgi:hypothetical protein